MRNPCILFIKKSERVNKLIKDEVFRGNHGCKHDGEYSILRIKPLRSSIATENKPYETMQYSLVNICDVIFDTKTKKFHKNIYSSLRGLPSSVLNIMNPICDVLDDIDFKELRKRYTFKDITEAVYLTGTYGKFSNDINYDDYSLMKIRYGMIHEVPNYCLNVIYLKYPEKLI